MTMRQRRGAGGFDEERYQKALAELQRLIDEGDDSDTSWQDSLPEAPDFPEGPDDTIAVIVSRGDERGKRTRPGHAVERRSRSGKAARGRGKAG